MNAVPLIARKRDGETLAPFEIDALVGAYTAGSVPDYQMAAFLMAAFLRGLDPAETTALADAMLHSGAVLDLRDIPGVKVDKHSTGGVGDKVSLILAPLVAACGVPVPMISGRGLGHTGGTLDKLEAIPGFRTDLSVAEYRAQLARIGVVMIGQTDEIAPADRKLYALRDVTATVEFIPFIAASIMSKKLAAGLDALVLDVKTGRGAFMQREDDARRLAETLVAIGTRAGTPTVALLTRMDGVLGRAAGNLPEVIESARCLRGDFAGAGDLMEVTLALAAEMLVLGGAADTPEEGQALALAALRDGRAWAKFVEMVEAQGGEVRAVEAALGSGGPAPAAVVRVPEGAGSVLAALDGRALGELTVAMGAGRAVKEDAVDPNAGFVLHAKPGDAVRPGSVLATLHTARTPRLATFEAAFLAASTFADAAPPPAPLVLDRLDASGWRGA